MSEARLKEKYKGLIKQSKVAYMIGVSDDRANVRGKQTDNSYQIPIRE